MVKLTGVLYVIKAVKNILSSSRTILKVAIMGATKEKLLLIKQLQHGSRKIKGGHESTMFYLKTKRYFHAGSPHQ